MALKGSYTVAEARSRVMLFLSEAQIGVVALGAAEAVAALTAFDRYGKGRHPAALTMGDCSPTPVRRRFGSPLLYESDDFARTDLA